MSHMTHRDLYVRLSDPSGKRKEVINNHVVWDADRFIAAQIEQHTGAKVKEQDRRIVSIATKEEYRVYKKGGRA